MKIAPSNKFRRGAQVLLNGKPVYVERDACDGTVFITDSKERRPGDNYWWVNKSDLTVALKVSKYQPKKVKPVDEYKDFFNSLVDKIPFNCQSCRRPLYAFTKAAKRATSAHILPKSTFPSIAKNPDNIVFLGCAVFGSSCSCHETYDSTVERRVKMPIYETVLKRFELLKPHLSAKEIIAAEEYLGITTRSLNLSADIQKGKVA